MRKFFLVAFALLAVCSYAQVSTDSVPGIIQELDSIGMMKVHQPEALQKRLGTNGETLAEDSEQKVQSNVQRGRTGYRVEVFSDNNVRTAKVQAASKKRLLKARMPQYRVYLVFEAPFWRVRLGDFTNRSAADAALQEVRRNFPAFATDLRVVRCTINPQ